MIGIEGTFLSIIIQLFTLGCILLGRLLQSSNNLTVLLLFHLRLFFLFGYLLVQEFYFLGEYRILFRLLMTAEMSFNGDVSLRYLQGRGLSFMNPAIQHRLSHRLWRHGTLGSGGIHLLI